MVIIMYISIDSDIIAQCADITLQTYNNEPIYDFANKGTEWKYKLKWINWKYYLI